MSLQRLVDDGMITVDNFGVVRMTADSWNRMVTIVQTVDRKLPEKVTDFGHPRRKGQTDYGE